MNEAIRVTSMVVAIASFCLFLLILILKFGYECGYKDGQVDALSGNKVIYQLHTLPDSSRVWQRKPK